MAKVVRSGLTPTEEGLYYVALAVLLSAIAGIVGLALTGG